MTTAREQEPEKTGEPGHAPVLKRSRIFVSDNGDAIILSPPTGGGDGFHVRLSSPREDIGEDYKRTVYCQTIDIALERMVWLTNLTGVIYKEAAAPGQAGNQPDRPEGDSNEGTGAP